MDASGEYDVNIPAVTLEEKNGEEHQVEISEGRGREVS